MNNFFVGDNTNKGENVTNTMGFLAYGFTLKNLDLGYPSVEEFIETLGRKAELEIKVETKER